MRFLGIFFLVMGLSATAAMAEGPTPASAEQKQKSPEQQAMDQLAEAGLRQALKAIQSSGGLYPFGMIQSGDTVTLQAQKSGPKACFGSCVRSAWSNRISS